MLQIRESWSVSGLLLHRAFFQARGEPLMRSCCYFCCILVTLLLVCIAMKISKSFTATPLSQQSDIHPALLLKGILVSTWVKGWSSNQWEFWACVYLQKKASSTQPNYTVRIWRVFYFLSGYWYVCVCGEWFHLRSIPRRQKARVALRALWDGSWGAGVGSWSVLKTEPKATHQVV